MVMFVELKVPFDYFILIFYPNPGLVSTAPDVVHGDCHFGRGFLFGTSFARYIQSKPQAK